jgi:hypothetical protein
LLSSISFSPHSFESDFPFFEPLLHSTDDYFFANMKSLTLLALAASAVAGSVLPRQAVPDHLDFSKPHRADSVYKKVRYGPLKLDAATIGANGQVISSQYNDLLESLEKPCTECYLQLIDAHLEFENGTITGNPGTYLHHLALVQAGGKASDGTCGTPGFDPFFSSGNEQPTEVYNDVEMKHNTGYHIYPESEFIMNVYVLNNEPVEKEFYVALNYELVDGAHPDFQTTRVAWIAYNHTDCKTPAVSEEAVDVIVPSEKGFTLTSGKWSSPWDGDILITGGHMHNGGTSTQIYLNDKVICDSQASYSSGAGGMVMGGERKLVRRGDGEHLSKMSACPAPGKVKKGDTIHIVSNYDFEKHVPIKKQDGHVAAVMALAKVYIAATQS